VQELKFRGAGTLIWGAAKEADYLESQLRRYQGESGKVNLEFQVASTRSHRERAGGLAKEAQGGRH